MSPCHFSNSSICWLVNFKYLKNCCFFDYVDQDLIYLMGFFKDLQVQLSKSSSKHWSQPWQFKAQCLDSILSNYHLMDEFLISFLSSTLIQNFKNLMVFKITILKPQILQESYYSKFIQPPNPIPINLPLQSVNQLFEGFRDLLLVIRSLLNQSFLFN